MSLQKKLSLAFNKKYRLMMRWRIFIPEIRSFIL